MEHDVSSYTPEPLEIAINVLQGEGPVIPCTAIPTAELAALRARVAELEGQLVETRAEAKAANASLANLLKTNNDTADALSAALRHNRRMREAAEAFLQLYIRGVESGDWGNWNPEKEPEVKALRAALSPSKSTGLNNKPA
jgi:Cft2 family RNA processing exonuclease